MVSSWLVGGVVVLMLGGCTSVDKLAQTLERRRVTSCIQGSGIYPPFVRINAFIATGGATVRECMGEPATPWPTRRAAPPVERAVPSEEPGCSCD